MCYTVFMSNKEYRPESLMEVIIHFSDERVAFDYLVKRRWENGVTCPRCHSEKVHLIESRMIWRCNGCRRQFSVKVGTIFEDSPIKLGKWLAAMWLIANCKNGISSYELGRAIKVTQKSAWHMNHRIRMAMENGSIELGSGSGEIESDESFIGGLAKNMHYDKRLSHEELSGGLGKTIVMGLIERGRERAF